MRCNRNVAGVLAVVLIILLAGCAAGPGSSGGEDGMLFANLDHPAPALSPGGGHLLGVRDGALVLCTYPEMTVADVFEPEAGGRIRVFAWAPGGEEFAYRVFADQREMVLVADLQGNTRVAGVTAPPVLYGELLQWSADGRYLLWDQPLSVWNRDTGELLVPETAAEDLVRSPLFAPDGRRLFFTRCGVDNTENLWVLDLQNGSLRRITDADDGDYPVHWLASDRLLVHAGKAGTWGGNVYGLAVVDVTTGEREVVLAEPERLIQAVAVSPDGERAVARLLNTARPDVGVAVLSLKDFSWDMVLAHHFPWEARWLDAREAVLTTTTRVGDRGTREYRLYRLRDGGHTELLAAGKNELRLLDARAGVVHYLERVELEPAVWAWACRTVDL